MNAHLIQDRRAFLKSAAALAASLAIGAALLSGTAARAEPQAANSTPA
jgi:hypothetical protein